MGSCQQRPRGCWMRLRWLQVPACGARWGRSAAPAAPLPARTGSQEAPAPGPRRARQGKHGRATGLAEAASLLRLAIQHSQAHTFAGASKQLLVPATLPVCNDFGMLSQHLLCHPKLAQPDFQKQRSSLLTHCFWVTVQNCPCSHWLVLQGRVEDEEGQHGVQPRCQLLCHNEVGDL